MEQKLSKGSEIKEILLENEVLLERHQMMTKSYIKLLRFMENKSFFLYFFRLLGLLKKEGNKNILFLFSPFAKLLRLTKKFLLEPKKYRYYLLKLVIHIYFPEIFTVKTISNYNFPDALTFKQFSKEKLKVCLFTAHLGPGGAERQITLLARLLHKKGYDVKVIIMNSGSELDHYKKSLEQEDISIHTLNTSSFYDDLYYLIKEKNIDHKALLTLPRHYRPFATALIKILSTDKPDILHCYLDIPNIVGGFAGLIAGISQIRLSLRSANPSKFPYVYSDNFKPLYLELAKKHPQIVFESNNKHGSLDYAKWLGLNPKSIEVIHNGIDIPVWEKKYNKKLIRKKFNINENKFVVLSVGRLSQEKRPLDILEVAEQVNIKDKNIHFIHVGIGNLEKTFAARIIEKRIGNITYLGRQQNIAEIMYASDIFLLTSEEEGLPNVILEAMLCGLPIVSTNVGGISEIMKDKVNGYLHKVGDIQGIAKNIIYLSSNEKERFKMAKINRSIIIDQFSGEAFVNKVTSSYIKRKVIELEKINLHKKLFNKKSFFLVTINMLRYLKKLFDKVIDTKNKIYCLLIIKHENNLLIRQYIKHKLVRQFLDVRGHRLNLEKPSTFSEKIQWLKYYYRDPLMTKCADKGLVKDYVKDIIGDKYLIPTLAIWKNTSEIDLRKLPNKFIIKTTWGSGQNILVKDKSKIDLSVIKDKMNFWLKPIHNHYFNSFEWCYKDIKPRIIVEKYIGMDNRDLLDYKIMCFNGKPKNLFVCSERRTNLKVTFFDLQWNKLPFKRKYENSSQCIKRPSNLDELLYLAEKLAAPFPFVRVDFYIIEKKTYFGELTFYPGNGTEKFEPEIWDTFFGELLILPRKKNG